VELIAWATGRYRLGGHWLRRKWDEAPGPTHILPIGLAQGRNQCGFFDKYSTAIACPRRSQKRQKTGPISERQTKSGESDETSRIRWWRMYRYGPASTTVWPT
jgi:hypothetical protein